MTATSISVSAKTVAAGNEHAVHITATVRPSAAGQTPTGTVTVKARRIPAGKGAIKARTTTLCVITLKSAKGSCRLSASELGPGKYTLTASYAANSLYAASTSAGKTLTVTK